MAGEATLPTSHHWSGIAAAVTESPQPGDFNHDGTVDAADYVVWRKGLGTTYTQDDYNIFRANFGFTVSNGAALPSANPLSAAVPKPTARLLLLLLLLLLLGAAAPLLGYRTSRKKRGQNDS